MNENEKFSSLMIGVIIVFPVLVACALGLFGFGLWLTVQVIHSIARVTWWPA